MAETKQEKVEGMVPCSPNGPDMMLAPLVWLVWWELAKMRLVKTTGRARKARKTRRQHDTSHLAAKNAGN